MSDSPCVLIIIATFNRADLLPEALDSALAQDYPHKKVAVVDDGSTDATETICRGYLERHPGMVLYRRKANGGCSSARNHGLDLVDETVGYVCFLDSDDRLLPGKLSREVRLLAEHPDADFTYADSVIFQEETEHERVQRVAAAGRPDDFALEHFLTNEAKCSAILYRAAILRDRRFRSDLRYNEDSEFLQRIALEHCGVYAAEPGCWVRSHPGSKSRNLLGINRAVYVVSRDILRDFPQFHAAHREAVDRNMERNRKRLFAELVVHGEWAEAAEHAARPLERLLVAWRLRLFHVTAKRLVGWLKRGVRMVRGYAK